MLRVLAVLGLVFFGVFIVGTCVVHGQLNGSVVGWGDNDFSQCDPFAPNENFIAIDGGWRHSIGLKTDGTVRAWLHNLDGQCDIPDPNENFIGVAAGHFHSLGVKSDGSIVAWGNNDFNQCDVPAPNVNYDAIAAGFAHSLGLKSNGMIVAWGWNNAGQCDVPAPNTDFIAVSGGQTHSLGLKVDGTVVAWGANSSHQCDIPAPNEGFDAIAAGGKHSLGLKSGTVVAWGDNGRTQCDVPAPNSDFVAIAAGYWHSLGVKSDGTIVAWGENNVGQCNVPAPNQDFVLVAGGEYHSLGLRGLDTPVETVFYATPVPEDDAVQLRWTLPNSLGGEGLRVYRALSEEGPYSCITSEPLPDFVSGSYVDDTAWPGGTFWYELRVLHASGEETLASDVHPTVTLPGTLTFGIRYVKPNPASDHTTIGYSLPGGRRSVRLSVYDAAGREVRRLDPPPGARGHVSFEWDGTAGSGERVASGVYFVRLEVDGAVATERVVMLR